MKVKILLFPLSLVIALAFGIFWVQPEVSAIFLLQSQKAEIESRLSEADRVIANIDTLDRSLTENAGDVQFVSTYLPKEGRDDRVIDEVNFLAGESGLLLVSTGLSRVASQVAQVAAEEVAAATAQAELDAAMPGSYINNAGTPAGSKITFVASKPSAKVRSTDVSVSVLGKYEQIKAFTDRIYRADNFQSFLSLDVSKKPQGQAGSQSVSAEATASDVLSADIKVRFGVLPQTMVTPGVFLKTFDSPKFDLAVVQDLRGRVTSELPVLDVTTLERVNPFLR